MVEINVPVATEAVPLGKVASPQAMTEGVLPGKQLCASAWNRTVMPKAPSPRGLSSECETGGVPSAAPERASPLPGSVFRPKSHVSGRKSQTIKQSAQKGGTKFGGGWFDRSRERISEKQQNKLKRIIETNSEFAQTNKIKGYILFDMGTIPKKY